MRLLVINKKGTIKYKVVPFIMPLCCAYTNGSTHCYGTVYTQYLQL